MNIAGIDEIIEADVLIIGGGFAGCFAALKCSALGRKVVVAEKGYVSICQSRWPGGNISVMLPGNNKDLWTKEFIEGGEYLNDQDWVKIQLDETYPLLVELDRWGKEFKETVLERDEKGELLRVKVHGDINTEQCILNGAAIMDTLRKKLIRDRVVFFDRMMMSDLVTDGNNVQGAVGFNYRDGKTCLFKAKAVILAAAGCSFKLDLCRLHFTGEGQVMAYEAGAKMKNLDQCEAKPLPRYSARIRGGFPTDVSSGARWLNGMGEEFMLRYDPEVGNRSMHRAEAFRQEMAAGRGPIYWDYTRIPPDKQEMYRRISPVYIKLFETMGIKLFEKPVDITTKDFLHIPSAPQSCGSGGGVDIDTSCASSINGLYAVGDNSCCPHQGTHPFGGQNLAFCLTSGNRAAQAAADYAGTHGSPSEKAMMGQAKAHVNQMAIPLTRTEGLTPGEITWKIQTILTPYRKSLTHKEPLEKALHEIIKIKEEDLPRLKALDPHDLTHALGVRSMLVIAEAILRSVLFREETRGKNVRKDFPFTDNVNWLKWIVVEKGNKGMEVSTEDVPTPYIQAPRAKYAPKRKTSDLVNPVLFDTGEKEGRKEETDGHKKH